MPTIYPGELIVCLDGHVVGEVQPCPPGGDPETVRVNVVGRGAAMIVGARKRYCECSAPYWRMDPEPAYHVRERGWIPERKAD
jgi:hypothetical protein